ncbi:hypothetical protein QU481_19970 [Crenobacter sp. SG2303]|uniref:Lipoprotein n=1 Tax=Crenobacter oryzisoli TaxID=3056844 RepID=A0ABT7XTK6_9NEIS|nr:hypothetical protein [Crenobacter sp. SG2303]MDN0077126.1 hypothetical protein [Crenobacter sp. SG2303]
MRLAVSRSRAARLGAALCAALLVAACAHTQPAGNAATAPQPSSDASAPLKVRPKRDAAPVAKESPHGPASRVAACIVNNLHAWKIPDDFIKHEVYPNGEESVMLINPANGHTGITVDLTPNGENTDAELYDNGMAVSNKWRELTRRCADSDGSAAPVSLRPSGRTAQLAESGSSHSRGRHAGKSSHKGRSHAAGHSGKHSGKAVKKKKKSH